MYKSAFKCTQSAFKCTKSAFKCTNLHSNVQICIQIFLRLMKKGRAHCWSGLQSVAECCSVCCSCPEEEKGRWPSRPTTTPDHAIQIERSSNSVMLHSVMLQVLSCCSVMLQTLSCCKLLQLCHVASDYKFLQLCQVESDYRKFLQLESDYRELSVITSNMTEL